jgi:deazaflavin-dependent oxidoreductase (nitroreductase family)
MVVVSLAFGVALTVVVMWLNNRRLGANFVNSVVDPLLLRNGIAGGARSEIGAIEHVGRQSGIVRRTPVRPVPTPDGFRIVVPLATESQWARNVLAAGHCTLEWRGKVYELDEPQLLTPDACADLAQPVRWLASRLGFRYLRLHVLSDVPTTDVHEVASPAAAALIGMR